MQPRRHLQLGPGGASRCGHEAGGAAPLGRPVAAAREPERGDLAARKPDRPPFRTASYSVFHFVYLPTPEPPDPGNAQAVPGINLPVDSQTYLRAKLVKQ